MTTVSVDSSSSSSTTIKNDSKKKKEEAAAATKAKATGLQQHLRQGSNNCTATGFALIRCGSISIRKNTSG